MRSLTLRLTLTMLLALTLAACGDVLQIDTTKGQLLVLATPDTASITVTPATASAQGDAMNLGIDFAGRAELDLEPGAYRVHVTAPGHVAYDEVHDVPAGQLTHVIVALQPDDGAPPPDPDPDPEPTGSLARLTERYWLEVEKGGEPFRELGSPTGGYWITLYPNALADGFTLDYYGTPWTFASSAYDGWDVLDPRVKGSTMNTTGDAVFIDLRREARVTIVWFSGTVPTWLAAWDAGQPVTVNGQARQTFEATLPAGDHHLGGNEQVNLNTSMRSYVVLLAEADGEPTPVPAGGITPRTACPASLHERYTLNGRPTFHPQVDPVHWCYFEHEHGSDAEALYGEHHTYEFGSEPHGGYKILAQPSNTPYRIDGAPQNDAHISFLQHIGFAQGRACQPQHSWAYRATDAVTGELIAAIPLPGEGVGLVEMPHVNSADGDGPLTPDCSVFTFPTPVTPHLSDVVSDIYGVRRIKTEAVYQGGYQTTSIQTGPYLNASTYTIAEVGPYNRCDGTACDDWLVNLDPTTGEPEAGVARWFNMTRTANDEWGRDSYGRFIVGPLGGNGFDPDPDGDGYFCTNKLFTAVLDCADANAIESYVKPGAEVILLGRNSPFSNSTTSKFWPRDGWHREYRDDVGWGMNGPLIPNTNIDGAVQGSQN